MTPISQLKVGDTISFETIAPSIINLSYSQVKYAGTVSWSVARSFDDIATLHRALYPSMDHAEVVDDYRSYDYIMFQTTTGPKTEVVQVLGVPWIKEDTLTVSGHQNLTLLFPSISPDNITYLYQLLKANGFSNYQVMGE